MQTSPRSYTHTSEDRVKKIERGTFTAPLYKRVGGEHYSGIQLKNRHPRVQARTESEGKDGLLKKARRAAENTLLGSPPSYALAATRLGPRDRPPAAHEDGSPAPPATRARFSPPQPPPAAPRDAPSPGPGAPSRPGKPLSHAGRRAAPAGPNRRGPAHSTPPAAAAAARTAGNPSGGTAMPTPAAPIPAERPAAGARAPAPPGVTRTRSQTAAQSRLPAASVPPEAPRSPSRSGYHGEPEAPAPPPSSAPQGSPQPGAGAGAAHSNRPRGAVAASHQWSRAGMIQSGQSERSAPAAPKSERKAPGKSGASGPSRGTATPAGVAAFGAAPGGSAVNPSRPAPRALIRNALV